MTQKTRQNRRSVLDVSVSVQLFCTEVHVFMSCCVHMSMHMRPPFGDVSPVSGSGGCVGTGAVRLTICCSVQNQCAVETTDYFSYSGVIVCFCGSGAQSSKCVQLKTSVIVVFTVDEVVAVEVSIQVDC